MRLLGSAFERSAHFPNVSTATMGKLAMLLEENAKENRCLQLRKKESRKKAQGAQDTIQF